MKRRTGIIGILIAILVLGIGYAAIANITLKVTGTGTVSPNDENFRVEFAGAPTTSGDGTINATIDSGNLTANMTVTGLTKTGEKATAVFTIQNYSLDVIANLTAELTKNTNTDFFRVTYSLGKAQLAAGGNDTTILTVNIETIKTPVTSDESTNIEVTVTASPAVNS